MMKLVWLVPLFPLIGFLINGLWNKKLSKSLVGIVGSGALLLSFILSVLIFVDLRNNPQLAAYTVDLFSWIQFGSFSVPFAFQVDSLSCMMMLIITGIGFLIHVYSTGYMHEEEDYSRYFSYLNLFCFSMLLLVLGNNFLVMFIGWEGVGLCSYLLIGFWFSNHAYNDAAKKAFIMNRVGDLAFIIALFMIYHTFGSLNYEEVFKAASKYGSDTRELTVITILLFIGATGKSAQIPLYTWLPDAMAGPTPVSALIHAATMVTAGVYMIVRSNILFTLAPFTQDIIATIGVLTAFLAASIAVTQNDIKKVLAYSTVSQLGFMFLALGLGAYTAAMFHVMTHAFFKALLFLGSGSVIHACSGNQDIRTMGGLKKHMPITHATFLVGCLAISGIFPLSGFFSKDEILAFAFDQQPVIWILALLTAAMTAFYMFRLYYLTFHGNFRGTHDQEHHLHESPASMTMPLVVLAILSAVGGFLGMPKVFHAPHLLEKYLEPALEYSSFKAGMLTLQHSTEWTLMGISLLVAIAAILVARYLYLTRSIVPQPDGQPMQLTYRLSQNKFYVDEIYQIIIVKPMFFLGKFIYSVLELLGIDAVVNGIGAGVKGTGSYVKLLQAGRITFYVFAMVVGVIIILAVKFL